MLNMMVDGEEADEQGVFNSLLERVDDEELRKMIRIHRDDEFRHADMLRERLAKVGVEPEPFPPTLRLVDRIDRHAGGCVSSFLTGCIGVMETYLLLQVIEERAIRHFPKIADGMRALDPDTAAVIERITRDEERHVKYARAISRKYAPDAETLARSLSRLRNAEASAFAEHSQEFLRFGVEHDLLESSRPERVFWRSLIALNDLAVGLAQRHPGVAEA
jgi:rubrerythrin